MKQANQIKTFFIFSILIFLAVHVVAAQQISSPVINSGSTLSPVDRLRDALQLLLQKRQADIAVPTEFNQPVSAYKPVLEYEQVVTGVVERTSPAVVSIVISKDVPVLEQFYINPFEDLNLPREFRDLVPLVPQLRQKGVEHRKIGGGTGFIISSTGLILTNRHVVGDTEASYAVFLNDGRKFTGRVISLHPVDDLALMKIEASRLPWIKLGDSSNLKLGQSAIAIGNALGEFQNTVSVGVISGLKRSIVASDNGGSVQQLSGLIQTDAAINPGNSGGPLLNLRGEATGVNTAIVSGAQNIGFAIPINRARQMVQQLNTIGRVEVPYLGIRYIQITENVQKKFNLPVTTGAYIYAEPPQIAVVLNSPADRAGIRSGDIITEVNGEVVTPQTPLDYLIRNQRVGQTINLTILRGGIKKQFAVRLEALPSNPRE